MKSLNKTNSNIEPKVGMLATMRVGGDRYAMVIVRVLTKNRIICFNLYDLDNADIKTINGIQYYNKDVERIYYKNTLHLSNDQDMYNDFINEHTYTKRHNGTWREINHGIHDGCSLVLGVGENYFDPDF